MTDKGIIKLIRKFCQSGSWTTKNSRSTLSHYFMHMTPCRQNITLRHKGEEAKIDFFLSQILPWFSPLFTVVLPLSYENKYIRDIHFPQKNVKYPQFKLIQKGKEKHEYRRLVHQRDPRKEKYVGAATPKLPSFYVSTLNPLPSRNMPASI